MTPPHEPPTTRDARASHHRRDIQGLRAVAVLLVVAFHAGLPVTGGFVGVDVFFVISGFVITGLLLRQWSATGRIDIGSFYSRRVRRLLPALAVMVAVTCAASVLLQPPNGEQQQTAQTAIGAMLLSANIIIPRLAADYFARAATANPLLHTWSLSAEEQFYLVYPALLAIGLVAFRRNRSLVPAAVIVGLAGAASVAWLLATTYAPRVLGGAAAFFPPFYASPARAWEFAAGALVAFAAPWFTRWPNWARSVAGIIGAGSIAYAAATIDEQTLFPGIAVFVPVAGASLLIAAGTGAQYSVGRMLSATPLVRIGDVSYSWYLWHWPLIVFGRLVLPNASWIPLAASLASWPVGVLSFRFVEEPFRHRAPSSGRRTIALAASATALVVLIAGGLGFGARSGWGQEWTLGAHVVLQRGCDTIVFDPVRCRWTSGGANGFVLLLGDSQSWAIADGLIPAAGRLGLDTVAAPYNACPFALPSAPGGDRSSRLPPACTARNERLIQYAVEQKPRVVVIANQSLAYAAAGVETWRASLSPAVRRFRATGIGVVIVGVAPLADEQSTRTSLLLKPTGDRFTLLADQRERRRNADAAERLAADDNPGTIVFDPTSVLCDTRRCRVAEGGTEYYTDQNHLSRAGALLLEEGLRLALVRAVGGAELRAGDGLR